MQQAASNVILIKVSVAKLVLSLPGGRKGDDYINSISSCLLAIHVGADQLSCLNYYYYKSRILVKGLMYCIQFSSFQV